MQLPSPLAQLIQSALNRLFELDEDAGPRFARLRGKLVRLRIDGLRLDCWLLFHLGSVEVLEHYDGEPDAVIRGAPLSLLALAGGSRSIVDADVEIEGDVEVARQVGRLLAEIDIDWQEHLSSVLGDTAVHQLDRASRSVQSWAGRSLGAVRENVADYLRDETSHLPHRWEIDEFHDAVDDLRDAVDRLEQRLASHKGLR